MAKITSWSKNGSQSSGNWSNPSFWSNGVPAAGDTVTLGNLPSSPNYTVTLDQDTGILSSLTINTGHATLNVNGRTLAANTLVLSAGTISGTGTVSGALTASNAAHLTAAGGTLEMTGSIVDSDSTLVLSATGSTSTLKLDAAGNQAHTLTLNGGTLLLNGSTAGLTVGTQAVIGAGKLTLAGSGATFSDAAGATISTGTISGWGVFNSTLSASGSASITAIGGILEMKSAVTNTGTLALKLGSASGSTGDTLKLDATSSATSAIFVGTSGETLELSAGASLALANQFVIGANTVKLDGATSTLTDTAGVTLAGGHLAGSGNLAGSTSLSGYGTVDIPLDVANMVTASGGTLEFTATVDATAQTNFHIAAGATLKFDAGVGTGSNHPTITFDGSTGTLDLTGESSEQGSFYAVVSGFQGNDQIVFTGAPTEGTETLTAVYDGTNTTLTAKDGSTVDGVIVLSGDFHNAPFVITENAFGQDIITICFMSGTMVRTPDGEIAVETLKRGDRVLTNDGHSTPVSWLGRQTVSTIFADKLRVLPIRIKAGALADKVPTRDLLISPDHAVLINGVLIQAGALVNGTSIVRESGVPTVFTYYHVEVDDHSLILAENAPAETFIDNVDRLAFDNWAEHQALYPEGKSINELPYPRAKAHRQVPVNIRVMLAERAERIGAVPNRPAVA